MSGREPARVYPVNGPRSPDPEMTMTTDFNHPHGEQEPDPALDTQAAASLSALFKAR